MYLQNTDMDSTYGTESKTVQGHGCTLTHRSVFLQHEQNSDFNDFSNKNDCCLVRTLLQLLL